MTKEEFEKQFFDTVYDWVVGYDADGTRQIVSKKHGVDYHRALSQQQYDDILSLFKELAQQG